MIKNPLSTRLIGVATLLLLGTSGVTAASTSLLHNTDSDKTADSSAFTSGAKTWFAKIEQALEQKNSKEVFRLAGNALSKREREKFSEEQILDLRRLRIEHMGDASLSVYRYVKSDVRTYPDDVARIRGELGKDHIIAVVTAARFFARYENEALPEMLLGRAIKAAKKNPEKMKVPGMEDMLYTLNSELGRTAYMRGRGQTALKAFEAAGEEIKRLGIDQERMTAGNDLWISKAYLQLRKNKKAVKALERALTYYDKTVPESSMAMSGHALAVQLYSVMGKSKKADRHVQHIAKIRPGDASQGAKPIYMVQPNWPNADQADGHGGSVRLGFSIDATGRVKDIKILEKNGSMAYVRPVKRALAKFRYVPAIEDGKLVAINGLVYEFGYTVLRH